MIYLFTALYCEAHIFIKQFHLEKNLENTRFQEFYHEAAGIRLTITGVGEIAAAAAVSSVCTEYKPKEGDVLLNIGTCAHRDNTGVFLCNKIIEQATGKTFYPDILYRHNFREKAIVTGMLPWNDEKDIVTGTLSWNDKKTIVSEMLPRNDEETIVLEMLLAVHSGENLYDMEAAAIYQAGSYFFGPHQMMFLKVVSDRGTAKEVSKEKAEHLMETYKEVLCGFIKKLHMITCRDKQEEKGLQQEEMLIEKLCADLHCSKTMRDSLRQHIHYLALAGIDYVSVIQELYREGLLPCKDKREGKLCFDELKRRLF